MNTFPLHRLLKGQCAHIENIGQNHEFGELDQTVTKRLTDLGFLSGTAIELIGTGLFGRGPYAVRLGGHTQFSLRRSEAEKIICRIINNESVGS